MKDIFVKLLGGIEMKKLFLTVLCLALLLNCTVSLTYADTDIIKESPNIKILINGKPSTYKSVPVTLNGRTLLPFREVLNNLGVANDDEHIIWNASQKSVTIIKDSTRIFLKIGSTTAYVNSNPVSIDVPPIIYKDRTYIPARFIAQTLGMKVSWDPVSKSVLLKDESGYNTIKNILSKTHSVMNTLNTYKYKEYGHISISFYDIMISSDIESSGDIDLNKKFLHNDIKSKLTLDDNVESNNSEVYSDSTNMHIFSEDKWTSRNLTSEEKNNVFNFNKLPVDDVLCAGLYVDSTTDSILLKGNIDLRNFTKDFFELQEIAQYSFKNVSTEIYIDKDTYCVNKINMVIDVFSKDLEEGKIDVKLTTLYSDYNTNISFNPPKEISLVPWDLKTSTRPTSTPTQKPAPTPTTKPTSTPTAKPTSPPASPTGLVVKMYNSNTKDVTNFINPFFQLINEGDSDIKLENVKIRYYFTSSSDNSQNFWCDWASMGNKNVTGKFVKDTSKDGYNYYLEIGFSPNSGKIDKGEKIDFKVRFAKKNWSNYSQSNDYSFNNSSNNYVKWNKVTAYIENKLVWGVEP